MTRHELASFALKLLGLYALVQALPLLQSVGGLAYVLEAKDRQTATQFIVLAATMIPLLMTAAAGVALWAYSRNLAPRLVGEDGPLGMSGGLTGREVQAIGFSVVAVLIFLHAVPQIAQALWAAYYAIMPHLSEEVSARMRHNFWQNSVPAVIQLVLAIVLFLQARGLADLWHRIRTPRYGRTDDTTQGPADREN